MPRKSIYMPDEAIEIVGCSEAGGFSQRIVGIIYDWARITHDAMPELAEKEWLYLMDMMNGTVLEGRHAHLLGSEVAESGKEDGLAAKWDLDPMGFAKRIDAMPLSSKVAIQDVAYRFWQPHGIVENYRSVLEECGARVKE